MQNTNDLPLAAGAAEPAANRREFLGQAAAAAVAVAAAPALLAACGESATAALPGQGTPKGAERRDFGSGKAAPQDTLHQKFVATLGSATNVTVPALIRTANGYTQQIVTSSSVTGTALATVLVASHNLGTTVVAVQVVDGGGKAWPARTIRAQSDLITATKDAFATNSLFAGVLRESSTTGYVATIFSAAVVQFYNDEVNDYYSNYLNVASNVFKEIISGTVSGFKTAVTTRDFSRS